MKTFKIAALCLSMAAAAFTVQAKEVKYEADVAIVGGGPAGDVSGRVPGGGGNHRGRDVCRDAGGV